MAHALRYYGDFYYDHNSSNSLFRVAIYEEDYAGSDSEILLSAIPFNINIRGQRDTEDSVILGSEAEVSFIAENAVDSYLLDEAGDPIETESGGSFIETEDATSQAGTIKEYDEILEGSHKQYLVKLIEDPLGSPSVKWVGYVEPDNCSREFVSFKYVYTISAVDGMATLKDYKYTSNGKSNGSPFNGYSDGLTIIRNAISIALDLQDFTLDIKIQLGTYSDQMTSTECALEESEFWQENFYTVGDSGTEYDSCYDVIEKVLKPFNCTLKQSDGVYWIQNIFEPSSYVFNYTSTYSFGTWLLSSATRTASDLKVTADNYSFISKGNLYKTDAISVNQTTLYNREKETEVVTNGGFDTDITGWDNGTAQSGADTFSLSWYDYPGVGGTLEASVGSGAGTYSFHQDITIDDVSATAPTVSVSWSGELTVDNRSGGESAIPLVRARLFGSTYIDGTIGQQPFISVGGFYTFSDTFDVAPFSSTNISIEIEVEIQDATTSDAEFHFDNIGVRQATGETPRDWLFNTNYFAAEFVKAYESILYFGDKIETAADSFSIRDTGGTLTSTWNRYGQTDNLELVHLYGKQLANNFSRHKNYVRVRIYDTGDNIRPHNYIYYDLKTYRIIGMTKDYREGAIDVDMIEVITTDVTVTQFKWKLDTVYGEDQ